MRVLYVHNGSDLYGASRSLLRLVSGTPGVEFHVVLPSTGPLSEALYEREIRTTIMPNLAVVTRQLKRPSDQGRFVVQAGVSALALAAIARRERVDLLHTNVASVVSSGLAARLAAVPHVMHVRDSFREFRWLWKPYSKYILATADAVVCVSQSVADQFPLGHSRVRVIHNGVPLDEFEEVPTERVAEFRDRFGLNDGPVIGLVGRIKLRRKGQDFLVRAMARLRETHRTTKCVFVGSPFPGNEEHLADLRRMIADHDLQDRIVLTGDLPDSKAAIKACDVIVMGSCEPEPFGGVVLEAMALRVAVIGTKIGGTLEQLDDEVTGLLIPPDDDEKLAQALDRLLSDRALAIRLTTAARVKLEREFSFPRMQERILATYAVCARQPQLKPSGTQHARH